MNNTQGFGWLLWQGSGAGDSGDSAAGSPAMPSLEGKPVCRNPSEGLPS